MALFVVVVLVTRAPRFRGYQQQDSQELLRYLLDSLKMEEFHVRKLSLSSPLTHVCGVHARVCVCVRVCACVCVCVCVHACVFRQ